jgi:hypothetical protein
LTRDSLRKNRKATSPAVSAVIITAVTVVLVLVSGSYAYQTIERQRGASEFDTVRESVLVFDDAVRDVAWDLGGSRSARFTVNYGQLQSLSGGELVVNASAGGNRVSENVSTVLVRYSISNNYINYGDNYKAYILGNENQIVTSSTESFGRALVEQKYGWVNITLGYRVRVMRTSVVKVGNDTVNYVDILIIKTAAPKLSTYLGDFDLAARNVGITTKSYGPYNANGLCSVSAGIGGSSSSATINLEPGKVVFNFVIAEVQVTT